MRLRPFLLVLTVLPLAVFSTAASDTAPSVSIDALSVEAGTSTLDVTGAISWAGATTIGTDAEGDATIPGIGSDFTAAIVTSEMGNPVMDFTIAIADSIPEVHAIGEVIQYNWPVSVGDSQVSLQAWRSARNQSNPRSTDPVFNVNVCTTNPDTGQGECTATPVNGEFADGGITWNVPASLIDADPGEMLYGSGSVYASPGATGFIWLNENSPVMFDTMSQAGVLNVPGAVDLALTKPGATSVASSRALAAGDGSFSETLDTTDVASGDYELVATTCYGGFEGCVSQSVPVTIP